MVALKSKQRLGCLAWLPVLLLHCQQDQHVIASSASEHEEFSRFASLPVNEGVSLVAEGQGPEAYANEPAVSKDRETYSLTPFDENGRSEVPRADSDVAQGGVLIERERAPAIRRVKLAVGMSLLAALLAMIGGVFLVQVEIALLTAASELRRLEALIPSAEKLSIAVGTSESRRLWASVEALLPELKQTLAEVNKQSAESGLPAYFSLLRQRGQRRELLNKVLHNVAETSEAVAALHKHARKEVEALGKSLRASQPTGLQARAGQLGKALGGEFAQAFVSFIGLNELRVDSILRTAGLLVERSNSMPAFTGYADEPLLLITIEDVTHIRRLVCQRDYVQSRIEGVTNLCARSLETVLRAEAVAAETENILLIDGVALVYGQHRPHEEAHHSGPDLQAAKMVLTAELPQLTRNITKGSSIEHLLDLHAALHDMIAKISSFLSVPGEQDMLGGGAHDSSFLREQAASLMIDAENWAQQVNSQTYQLLSLLKDRVGGRRKAAYCPGVLEKVAQLAQKMSELSNLSLQTCRDVADELHSDNDVPELLGTLKKGLMEGGNVSKRYAALQALRAQLDLLSFVEADVGLSVEMMNGVETDKLKDDTSSAKLISSARTLVARELEALKAAEDVATAVARGGRLSEAVYSAMFAKHEGTCLQLENEHKLARGSAWRKIER
ncbi:hypothetical protein ACSSS7_005833 [Eimeria intestinalis]